MSAPVSSRAILRTILTLAFLLFAAGQGLAQEESVGSDSETFLQQRARLEASGDYTTELPKAPERRPPRKVDWGFWGKLIRFFGWLILGAVVLFLLGLLIRALIDRDAKALAEGADDGGLLLQNVSLDVDMQEVDRLAAAGSYGEAIHLLLLRTISELVRLAGVDIRPAWTSREIASSIPIADEPRADLHELVQRAELGHFAERPASESDYHSARQVFARFHERLKGGRS